MGQLVLAVQDMPRGSEVIEDAITAAPWPLDQLPPSAIINPADAIGLLVRRDIKRGEPLLESLLVENALEVAEAGSDWALYIPEGKVAISIPAPRLSGYYGSNLLRDGDHVNILVSFLMVDLDEDFQTILPNITVPVALTDLSGAALGSGGETGGEGESAGAAGQPFGSFVPIPGGPSGLFPAYIVPSETGQRPRLVTQQIIQDAIVLGVGAFLGDDEDGVAAEPTPIPDPDVPPTATPEGGPPPPTPIPPPETVTLIISPQDSTALTYFMHSPVKFTFALRSASDTTLADTTAVTLEYILEQFRIELPTVLPYGLEPAIRRVDVPALDNAPLPEFVTLPPSDSEYLCIGVNCP